LSSLQKKKEDKKNQKKVNNESQKIKWNNPTKMTNYIITITTKDDDHEGS
jgi:hypothetical protein